MLQEVSVLPRDHTSPVVVVARAVFKKWLQDCETTSLKHKTNLKYRSVKKEEIIRNAGALLSYYPYG